VLIPIAALLLPESPAAVGLGPLGAEVEPPAPPRSGNPFRIAIEGLIRGVRSMDFWLLAISFGICGFSTNGLIGTHLIVGGKFTTSGSSFRGGENGALVSGEHNWRLVVHPSKA